MRRNLTAFSFFLLLILPVTFSACSNQKEQAELDEVKQELAELKKQIASSPKVGDTPEIKEPDADDVAFEEAKADGRVRAYGKYAKDFENGKHLSAADQGAWASAKRQNSVAAYKAYRLHFPDGKNLNQSYIETHGIQSRSSDKALAELGYDVADFASFGAVSIDSDGKVEKGSFPVISSHLDSDSSVIKQISENVRYTEEACENDGGISIQVSGVDICFVLVREEEFKSSAYDGQQLGIRTCTGEVIQSGKYCREPIAK